MGRMHLLRKLTSLRLFGLAQTIGKSSLGAARRALVRLRRGSVWLVKRLGLVALILVPTAVLAWVVSWQLFPEYLPPPVPRTTGEVDVSAQVDGSPAAVREVTVEVGTEPSPKAASEALPKEPLRSRQSVEPNRGLPTVIAERPAAFEAPAKPVAGTVKGRAGWYRHPLYGDWRYDPGTEILAPAGSTVCAMLAGEVLALDRSHALEITIDHGDGWRSTYFPVVARPDLHVGMRVDRGEKIGQVAKTDAGASYLRVTLRQNGNVVNPAGYW